MHVDRIVSYFNRHVEDGNAGEGRGRGGDWDEDWEPPRLDATWEERVQDGCKLAVGRNIPLHGILETSELSRTFLVISFGSVANLKCLSNPSRVGRTTGLKQRTHGPYPASTGSLLRRRAGGVPCWPVVPRATVFAVVVHDQEEGGAK